MTIPASNAITIQVPAGTNGTFTVVVAALTADRMGPVSTPTAFTLGSSCTAPPRAPTNVIARVNHGVATLTWDRVDDTLSYVVAAGSTAASANLFNADIGNTTQVSAAGLPAGFRAFARIFANNACGVSAASQDVLVQ